MGKTLRTLGINLAVGTIVGATGALTAVGIVGSLKGIPLIEIVSAKMENSESGVYGAGIIIGMVAAVTVAYELNERFKAIRTNRSFSRR